MAKQSNDKKSKTICSFCGRSAAPGHVVLAESAAVMTKGRAATGVAAGPAGSGKALVLTAGPTWRWAFLSRESAGPLGSRTLGGASPHARFWGQAVRWLAGVEAKQKGPGVTVWLDRGEAVYAPGEAVTVYARVSGADGATVADASVEAELTNVTSGQGDWRQEATKLSLSPSPGRPGEYEATFTPPRTGRHELAVRAEAGELGEAGIKFEVETPSPETERYDMDEENLLAIAEATGGRYVPLSGIEDLVASLHARQSEKRTAVVFELWNGPLFFVALVAMAGAEWFIRRRLQMA